MKPSSRPANSPDVTGSPAPEIALQSPGRKNSPASASYDLSVLLIHVNLFYQTLPEEFKSRYIL